MLQDRYGRQFPYLRLSITDVCNFRCNYCLPNGYEGDAHAAFLRADEIRRLVTAFAELGMWKIRLTGGEPSVRKDLPELIRTVANVPGIRRVAMTTNGYKLKQQVSSWRAAGLDSLNISVDSLDPRAFAAITGHDKLQEILAGIEQALTLDFSAIKLNAVLLRGINDQQLDRFLDWLRTRPVSMRFIELMQTGDNAQFFDRHHVPGSELVLALHQRGWQELPRTRDGGPAREFVHPDYQGQIGLIAPYSKDFCDSCNRLRVTALGDLRLCLFGDAGTSLRDLLQHDEQRLQLKTRIESQLQLKKISHFLHDGNTGATPHLASCGG
ncbi:GTP 3',8-cyclase MoaA [Permianibacter sp. IMCC34836]|uniref:GTP 3',8-cyclase MoaA n=1 Tax=Permianibacter fluminis TaxID=2738515 RepID=UPI0015574633|nr:GTP 3',8-cyclase MoaA [Permianibacter fluminis]NQD37248.1 GTP 3',8-cyclase MoaA [Permianibacter fluminis]